MCIQELKELAALAYRDTTAENREYWKNEMGQALREIHQVYDDKLEGMRGELETYYNLKVTCALLPHYFRISINILLSSNKNHYLVRLFISESNDANLLNSAHVFRRDRADVTITNSAHAHVI